jgi:8-oxo-dGTP pyrophosphatase MutT (NUDIX family)
MRLRPRAEVICFKDNKVLCNLNRSYVVFPGGGIDPKESAIEAAKREAREEAARRVINCTIAHEPTVQIWPKGYAETKGGKWAAGYDGGLTHWMTGSTSEEPQAEKHPDFEPGFAWHPVAEVLARLKREGAKESAWADDVRARIEILTAHQDLKVRLKEAGLRTPTLSFLRAQQG